MKNCVKINHTKLSWYVYRVLTNLSNIFLWEFGYKYKLMEYFGVRIRLGHRGEGETSKYVSLSND